MHSPIRDGQPRGLSRRRFLRTSAVAGALTLVPRHLLGGAGRSPPSETLTLGIVGAGGRGADNLEGLKHQRVGALCDVDWERAAETFQRFPSEARLRPTSAFNFMKRPAPFSPPPPAPRSVESLKPEGREPAENLIC